MKKFNLQIVTPDGLFYDGEAEKLLVRTSGGDVCILANHTDFVSPLGIGVAKISIDGKARKGACIGGMVSVMNGNVSLVPSTFEWEEDIDLDRAIRSKDDAEKKLQNISDRHQADLVEAKLKRALIRIEVAKK